MRISPACEPVRLAGWVLFIVLYAYGCTGKPRPPHIILYMVDALRADAIGAYGNSKVQTPYFNRVASHGVRFARAYAASSWTRPSVVSIFTGEYPTVHGAIGRFDQVRPDLPILAEELRKRGYETVGIVANPNLASVFGLSRGFAEYQELYAPVDHVRAIEPQELIAPAAKVVDRALDILRRPRTQPLFLFVFTIDPHAPYLPPPPYDRLYDPNYQGPVDGSFRSLFALALAGPKAPEADRKHLRALYDAEVAYADHEFGRLLAALEQPPWRNCTLLVVTSDHGEEFFEHGRLDHGHSVYEELIRVPLLVVWPGRNLGWTDGGIVSLVDLYPTILDYAGVPLRGQLAQRSLRSRLERPQETIPLAEVFAEVALYEPAWEALIMPHGKLIHNRTSGAFSYFDFAADPGELHPLPSPAAPLLRLQAWRQQLAQRRALPPQPLSPKDLTAGQRQALEALGYGDFFPPGGHSSNTPQ